MSPEYAAKYRDPRWQKKRLEVMERAGFKCEACGRTDSPLAVHHLCYNGDPWETESCWLECLCEKCHYRRKLVDSTLSDVIRCLPTKGLLGQRGSLGFYLFASLVSADEGDKP